MKKMRPMMLIVFFICTMPFLGFAGSFDGSAPLLCAVVETFECDDIENCQQGTAQDIDIPQFLNIDFKKKMISGKQGKESYRLRTGSSARNHNKS